MRAYNINHGRVRQDKKWAVLALFSIALFCFATGALLLGPRANKMINESEFKGELDDIQSKAPVFDDFFETKARRFDEIKSGENLFSALSRLGVSTASANKFVYALGLKINLRTLMPGDVVMVETLAIKAQPGEKFQEWLVDPMAVEVFTRDQAGLAFSVRAGLSEEGQVEPTISTHRPDVRKENFLINGEVESSVYASIVASGGNAQLVNSFSDIFAWQFDFFKDTQPGDTYQMIVEKNISEGRTIGYGNVLAAEYTSGHKKLRGFYFESADKTVVGFFDQDGQSLKNSFLKSPLKLASISSGFNKRRFHPIQKRYKPHNGVDYPANRGTPFMAVADGKVVNAGHTPFNGNWVRIKHFNGYETEYLHATKLASGISLGKRVSQGQVIGYVGKTGLASGYHLHYGMKKDGNYVNPASQRFNKGSTISARYLAEFKRKIEPLVIAFTTQAPASNTIVALNTAGQRF